MLPGCPGYKQMTQLAIAHGSKSDKESVFIQQVLNIGGSLPISLKEIRLETTGKVHHCLEIKAVAHHLLQNYPEKLLSGFGVNDFAQFQQTLEKFWICYKKYYPAHPVFVDHCAHLSRCVPLKFHSDEGTGLRKTAVYQFSWGPVLASTPASWDRYYFWSCMPHEDYKNANAGYEVGNMVLDELCSYMAKQAMDLYTEGLNNTPFGQLYFAWTGHEGDLPAQARAYHCARNFDRIPNPMCPWCLADDVDTPHTDYREEARWRNTVCLERPWRNPGPFTTVPGGNNEMFLSKDLFHLCHLGVVRGFAINVICYLTSIGLFVPLQMNEVFLCQQVFLCWKEV